MERLMGLMVDALVLEICFANGFAKQGFDIDC